MTTESDTEVKVLFISKTTLLTRPNQLNTELSRQINDGWTIQACTSGPSEGLVYTLIRFPRRNLS